MHDFETSLAGSRLVKVLAKGFLFVSFHIKHSSFAIGLRNILPPRYRIVQYLESETVTG